MIIPPIDDVAPVRWWTPVVVFACAPAFGATIGASVAVANCIICTAFLPPTFWFWPAFRQYTWGAMEEGLRLGAAHGFAFALFVIACTRMRATTELAMRCLGCGLLIVVTGIVIGGAVGELLGRFEPWLWGWALPAVPGGIDTPTFAATQGTGCGAYIGTGIAIFASCILLHRRWRAAQQVTSRGFAILPRSQLAPPVVRVFASA